MSHASSVIIGTLALVLFAGMATADPVRDDLQVFRHVSQQVLTYSSFTIFDDVRASIEDGVVTLTGRVTMPYKRDAIERRIARIEGVQMVRNDLRVLPVSAFDDELRLRAARAIYGHISFAHYAAMANPPIHIVVEGGRITLTGVVHNEVERRLAQSLATSLGALSVTNDLRTDAEARADLERIR